MPNRDLKPGHQVCLDSQSKWHSKTGNGYNPPLSVIGLVVERPTLINGGVCVDWGGNRFNDYLPGDNDLIAINLPSHPTDGTLPHLS